MLLRTVCLEKGDPNKYEFYNDFFLIQIVKQNKNQDNVQIQ